MGKPSVRFDEGRERVGHWPYAFQSNPPAYSTERRRRVSSRMILRQNGNLCSSDVSFPLTPALSTAVGFWSVLQKMVDS